MVVIVLVGVVVIVLMGMVVIVHIGVVVIVMHRRASRDKPNAGRGHHDIDHLAGAFYGVLQGFFISGADEEYQVRRGNGYKITRRGNECMRISSQWHQGLDIGFVSCDLARNVGQDALRGNHVQRGRLRPGRD